jgi:(4-(4-[2-(gamma-L-glutamylamino)ethyl]phenoxymethyl)furan-2-yl)methanamine synthase
MSWLALDIGGANLKAADGLGWTRIVPFSLSRDPQRLDHELEALLKSAPPCSRLAITMTGELCDAFHTKVEGVRHILRAVEAAAVGREIFVYLVDGEMVPVDVARDKPLLAAASNWHALARFACRFFAEQSGLLVDVGSTTTDLVPIAEGQVVARAVTDTERLLARELVYSGVCHTPLSALVREVPWRGGACPVAGDCFATTADAYVVLGDVLEQLSSAATADGRPLTRRCAQARLARMICADSSTFSESDAHLVAQSVHDAQLTQLRDAAGQVASGLKQAVDCFVVSGVGEFLARRMIHQKWPAGRIVPLAEELGSDASVCAPAHALAVLARAGGSG